MSTQGNDANASAARADDVELRLRLEKRAWLLAGLERDVLALLAENPPDAASSALMMLAKGLEAFAAPGTLVSILVTDDRDGGVLVHGAAPSLPPEFVAALGAVPIAADAGSCGTAAHRRAPVAVADIAIDPLWPERYRRLALANGLRACWSVPISASDGALLGTFAFYYREARSPTDDELALIDAAARLTRIVLERQRAEIARARSSRRKRALFATASVLAATDDVTRTRVLERVLEALASALEWDAANLWLFEESGHALACVAQWGRGGEALDAFLAASRAFRLAIGVGLPGRVVAACEPAWLSIVEHDAEFPRWSPARAAALSEGFAVPVVEGGKTIGAIELFTSRPEPADPDLLLALRTAGLQIGQFVRRARLVEELRETVRFSELFSGILAHDLRNPLNTLVMGTEILGASVKEEKPRATLARMRSAQVRMTRMIDQLLDLTRSRSGGGIAVARTPLDVAELARSLVSEMAVAFPARRIELTAAGDARGEWDPDRLGQVLSNLLGNAIHHGEADGIVAMRIDGGESACIRIETHNLGAIPTEQLPYLFDPFKRAGKTTSPSRGLGLGLTITKLIVEAHGGTVDVSSSKDDGTRFVVTLPRMVALTE